MHTRFFRSLRRLGGWTGTLRLVACLVCAGLAVLCFIRAYDSTSLVESGGYLFLSCVLLLCLAFFYRGTLNITDDDLRRVGSGASLLILVWLIVRFPFSNATILWVILGFVFSLVLVTGLRDRREESGSD